MQDHPTPDAILAAVADWLRDTAASALPPHARFEAKVAASAVDLVRREITAQATPAEETAILSSLTEQEGSLETLTRSLCVDIASGKTDLSTPGLADLLVMTTLKKLEIDQPDLPAADRLRKIAVETQAASPMATKV